MGDPLFVVGTALTASGHPRYARAMRGVSRKIVKLAAIALLGLMPLPVPAQRHEHKRAERAEITVLEQRWRQAQMSGNIPEMDRLLAEDFLGITASGQVVTKAQQLDRMRTRRIDLQRMDVFDSKIKISGDLAVVTSLVQINGMMDGHTVDGSFCYTRVYQRGAASMWRITNFEATRVPGEASINGPRIPPAAGQAPHAGAPNLLPTSQAGSASPLPPS